MTKRLTPEEQYIQEMSQLNRKFTADLKEIEKKLNPPHMPSERRKELVCILKPWRTIEQLANWTDRELVEQYRLLCQGDPHLEEGNDNDKSETASERLDDILDPRD